MKVDDERKKFLAYMLREHFDGHEERYDETFGMLVEHCILGYGHEDGCTNEQAANILADLIGPGPGDTCEIDSWYDKDELDKLQDEVACTPEDTFAYRCTKCGCDFRYDRGTKPKYCPNCGRKVVGK